MATATLQSFNVFLTDRLTAAAVDIYGFVERTILDYQEEVNRAKLENQRLQRLLDLVYRPEIRLHRADSRQIDLPTPTQEVSAQEQQIEKECIPSVAKEDPVILAVKEEQAEPWTSSVETPVPPEYSSVTDNHTRIVTVGEQTEYEIPSQDVKPLPSFGAVPTYTKKKNSFFCNICNQPFLKKDELKLHLAAHSTKGSHLFTCYICGRVTETRSHMIYHMRTHTGEKPFICPICGNRYKLKGHMKEHIRTHTGERPYTCYICGKSFNRSTTMSKHARVKHKENLPYKCMQCSQRFPLLVMFKQHMKMVHDITFSV
ncbi:zinc finger protein 574-like isoform X2 [Thunnus albacares]|uniref:zinc finger protein 574-like isoform X2 n=1 Tax=Thunnus maccoyii TaxID=8240 RepID=UPI001C4BB868|nr:zinc finger protein 574-like isoform X2 [Thunnus maccoyii]XP_044205046.1 zinc finger protein 574-like isoform X2 [Thunnus albacares]